MEKKYLVESLDKVLEEKGKRKFTQSVDLIINFRGIDFSKPENRFNVDVALPRGRGQKAYKIVVVAEKEVAFEAKKANADLVMSLGEFNDFASDKVKLKSLLKDHVIITQPNFMAEIAKRFGQYLSVRGKLPKPIVKSVEETMKMARDSVRVISKGKYLPVVHVFVGTENMSKEDLVENIEKVFDLIVEKVGAVAIKSAYLKLTMGKPVKMNVG